MRNIVLVAMTAIAFLAWGVTAWAWIREWRLRGRRTARLLALAFGFLTVIAALRLDEFLRGHHEMIDLFVWLLAFGVAIAGLCLTYECRRIK